MDFGLTLTIAIGILLGGVMHKVVDCMIEKFGKKE